MTDPALEYSTRLAELARPQVERLAERYAAECTVVAAVDEDAVYLLTVNGTGRPQRILPGSRAPLIPPIGSALIATAGSTAIRHWVKLLDGVDEGTRRRVVENLGRVAERGYSIALREPEPLASAARAQVRTYSSPLRTQADRRRFVDHIIASAEFYEPDLVPTDDYVLRSITAPVVGPLGEVEIALRVGNFDRPLSGAEVHAWTERLRQAAADVADTIARELGRGRADTTVPWS